MKKIIFLTIVLVFNLNVFSKSDLNSKEYFTHFNGARPFMVVVDKQNVDIYRRDFGVDYDTWIDRDPSKLYPLLVKSYKSVLKVFIGKDSGEFGLGNTILLETASNKYTYIGDEWVYEFRTTDKIQSYYSMIGNSDVPYPVALGEKNVYFPMDGENGYLSRSYFKGFPEKYSWKLDSYNVFWDPCLYLTNCSDEGAVKKLDIVNVLFSKKY